MRNDWMIDVLNDLYAVAAAKGLHASAKQIAIASKAIRVETAGGPEGARYDADNPDRKVEGASAIPG